MRAARWRVWLGASMTLGLHAVSLATPATQQATAFRESADLVSVDVSVRSGGSAVEGLTAADFVLLDNGVRQQVQRVEPAAMPLDVTVVADVSADAKGVWVNGFSAAATRAQVEADLQAIGGLLRPDDRVRLIATDSYIQPVFPFQTPPTARIGNLETAGASSTYDALIAAMSRASEPNRRHLVIAWVAAYDSISGADAQAVRDVAQHADAVVHIVQRATARFGRPPAPSEDATPMDILQRTWRPFRRQDLSLLTDVAELTGGTFEGPGNVRNSNVADTFRDIFTTFRQGHVLRYAPQGVRREGAHQITVTVPRLPSAEIRARRAYFVEAVDGTSPAGRTSGSGPAPSSASPSALALERLLAAFDLGHDQFTAAARPPIDLREVIRLYRARNPLAASRVRASVFALELAAVAGSSADKDVRSAALDLLVTAHDMVRHPLEPDAFECRWYAAEVTALSIGLNTGAAAQAATHAAVRCPGNAALMLGRAIAADQFLSTDGGRARASDALKNEITGNAVVMRLYDEATQSPATAFEARVRAAWLAYRMGDLDTAAARLSGATSTSDRVLLYFKHLINGQVLRERKQFDAAAQAYRDALTVWPGAQSARIGLMTVLMQLGQRPAAEELAERIQSDTAAPIDPWWLYWQGRYYAWPGIMASLMGTAP